VVEARLVGLRVRHGIVTHDDARVFKSPASMASFRLKSLTIQENRASSLGFFPDGANGVAEKS
jgi:hypothetical protein